jgi:dUTPase
LDYTKQIGLIVHNSLRLKDDGSKEIDFDRVVSIKSGTPVAQIKLVSHSNYLLSEEYRENSIRDGGYGSTNEKM